ncbi:uncharacterized protein LOC131625110 [Vicia villosa]|uniref:uncharacterized protein LOC131625110 n=1 Tax=Vicia villosa TaxID=3911 RepID=UPI00273C1BF1|nr:uncharacterized protein LOC131625110 [Vicia villosa]
MSKVALPEIPTHSYTFHPIERFLKGDFKHDMLYDVIGVLQDVVKTQQGGGGRKSCVNITLRDVEGNVIELVLWEDYAKQFVIYTTPNNFAGPTIIVLTHSWCKTNAVSGLPCLSNAWNGSKLYINLEHPQVDEFKASFGSNLPVASQSLTCDSSVQSNNNFWTKLSEVKSIRAVTEFGRDCFATTIGTTTFFNASRFGWYFESSGNTDAERAGEDNPKIWPTHLDALLNRQMVFRIKYQSQFRRFSIVKILNEDGLYNKFDMYLAANEVTQTCEQSSVAQPESAADHKGSPSASCSSTPAKRVATSTSINDLIQADELTPKQSATKSKNGKKTKHLKKD